MKVTSITFDQSGKAHIVVEIPESRPFVTNEQPRMPRVLFRMFPYLVTQRCVNDLNQSFRQEALATEIPHLFEHLLLEIQKQVRRGIVENARITGETAWNWTTDPRGRFHVIVDYDNEIVALGSIRLAERLIRALDSRELADLNIEREIKKLRELRRISRRFITPRKVLADDFEPAELIESAEEFPIVPPEDDFENLFMK